MVVIVCDGGKQFVVVLFLRSRRSVKKVKKKRKDKIWKKFTRDKDNIA